MTDSEKSFWKKIPFVKTPPAFDLFWTLILVPLWWILGIRFAVFHVLAILMAAKTIQRKKQRREKCSFPSEGWWLLAFAGIYFLSLLINLSGTPSSRVLASLNNFSFWILGWVIIWIIANNITQKNVTCWLKAARILGLFTAVFVLISMMYGLFIERSFKITSLLGVVLPDSLFQTISEKAPLLKHSLVPRIIAPTLIFKKWVPRPVGFNVYGTALGATLFILIALTWAGYKQSGQKKGKAVVLFLQGAALVLSFSRIAVLGFILAAVLIFLVIHLRKRTVHICFACFCLALIVFVAVISPQKVYKTVSDFRKGSTSFRIQLYGMTLEKALKKPILGYGYKPRPEDLPVPVGSHSMYVGILYKTGFAGSAVFLFFWAVVIRRWWLDRTLYGRDKHPGPLWSATGTALIGGLFWMLTEDLDAPPLTAFLFFLVVGIILSRHVLKEVSKEK